VLPIRVRCRRHIDKRADEAKQDLMFRAFGIGAKKGADLNAGCLSAGSFIGFVDHEPLLVRWIASPKPDVAVRAAIEFSPVGHFGAVARRPFPLGCTFVTSPCAICSMIFALSDLDFIAR
jgi:hypothetical protein